MLGGAPNEIPANGVADRVKLLCVAGIPHSGSTILGNLLGQLDGFATVGELYYLSAALDKGFACGCGVGVRECDWWRDALAAAFGEENAGEALAPDRYYMALRQLPRTIRRSEATAPLGRAFARLLRAVARRHNARVVVDTSKSPSYFELLRRREGVEPYLLHLVRHPAATAYSWAKIDEIRSSARLHGLVWDAWNAIIEARWAQEHGRYLRVRYEDFARLPRETLVEIATFVGERPTSLPVKRGRVATIAPTHTVAGNDARFRHGEVRIRLDEAWRHELPSSTRTLIEVASWPLRRRYGYTRGSRR